MANVAQSQGRSRNWSIVGWFGMLAGYLIGTYYSVIAGWSVVYIFKNGGGNFRRPGRGSRSVPNSMHCLPVLLSSRCGMAFSCSSALLILVRGLQKGIESTVKVLMPALVYAAAGDWSPTDFSKAIWLAHCTSCSISTSPPSTGRVILVAVGQAFFSIGVAMGLMMGFGAYLPKEVSIARSAVIIATADTLVAIIAGLAIFPIVFANGLDPAEGPGLIFVSLPIAFGSVTGGLIFRNPVFYPVCSLPR